MKITIDTETNIVKLGRKTFNELDKTNQNVVAMELSKFFVKNTKLSDYEEDSMWMSYRYCIGRHTIASHMRAGDIASNCYGRMSEERSIFTAYDINREIEQCMIRGCGPNFYFPITSLNRIYTSALDIFCQFVEDFDIQTKEELLKYKDVHIKLADNERGYTFETVTWEEYLRPKVDEIVANYYGYGTVRKDFAWKYFELWEKDPNSMNQEEMKNQFAELVKWRPKLENFYLNDIDDLMVWNNLCHLFDLEHHHKSILVNGDEVEWYWTYTHDVYQKEDGNYYRKEIGYKRIRVPVDAHIGSATTWIPDSSIKKDLY